MMNKIWIGILLPAQQIMATGHVVESGKVVKSTASMSPSCHRDVSIYKAKCSSLKTILEKKQQVD
jgi:hypothetical protein